MSPPVCLACGGPMPGVGNHTFYCSRGCYLRERPAGIGEPDPTPQEIAVRAARIRSQWSEEEALQRLRPDWREVLAWTPPVCRSPLPGGLQG